MQTKLESEEMYNLEFAGKCFADAMIEVMGTMVGFEIREDAENVSDAAVCTGEISGVMLLYGREHVSLVSLTMSREAAALAVAYMTGILPAELTTGELADGVAELVNMVAGRAKAELAGTNYHFNITPPFAITGKDHCLMYKDRTSRIQKQFSAGDIRAVLQVVRM